jgi:hypothetical protein
MTSKTPIGSMWFVMFFFFFLGYLFSNSFFQANKKGLQIMFTTPEVQNVMPTASAGDRDIGTINFFLSDAPHRGAKPNPTNGELEEYSVRRVLHTYVYDSPPPQGFFSISL